MNTMPVNDEVRSVVSLPLSTEVIENQFRINTDYKYNDNDKIIKVVRTYKTEKRIVSKNIALRRRWSKFGESVNDKSGPDPMTTIIGEDVYMQAVTSKVIKVEDNKPGDKSGIDKSKGLRDKKVVFCRTCSGDHWTSKCPWKDIVLAGGKIPDSNKKGSSATPAAVRKAGKTAGTSKYLPQSIRNGAAKLTEATCIPGGRRDDTTAIRVSNLSEFTTETDLEELVKPFGPIQKLYLAKDKHTGQCKGFAYIHFKFRKDACEAIARLNGHQFDHLLLNVDWSRPPDHTTDEVFHLDSTNRKIVRCLVCGRENHSSKCSWNDKPLVADKEPDVSALTPKNKAKQSTYLGENHGPKFSWERPILTGGSILNFNRKAHFAPGKVASNLQQGTPTFFKVSPTVPKTEQRDDSVCISNLSKFFTESDLENLLKPFGRVRERYFPKYKRNGLCKGFAKVTFRFWRDAVRAIVTLNGHIHDDRVLSVRWSKPRPKPQYKFWSYSNRYRRRKKAKLASIKLEDVELASLTKKMYRMLTIKGEGVVKSYGISKCPWNDNYGTRRNGNKKCRR